MNENEKVLVLGLGKSGMATIRHLRTRGVPFIVNDGASEEKSPYAKTLYEQGIPVTFGHHPLHLLDNITCIVKSPGIPYTNPLLVEAQKRTLPILTEVELGYLATAAHIVAITGSNGKTTTTTLVGDMFEHAQKKSAVCGNIGTPFLEVAKNTAYEWLVAELSSFQLKGTRTFQPKIGALLNFSETHLDFHGDTADYLEAKLNVFRNQTAEDFAILNADVPLFETIAKDIPSSLYWFSRTKEVAKGAFVRNGAIYVKTEKKESKIIEVKDIPLKGTHNLENALAASLIAFLSGINEETIARSIQQFAAIEHRLEPVGVKNGVMYYNDSKATNPVSTIKACEAFTEPLVLILGGKDRGSDLSEVAHAFIRGNVRAVIAFGETNMQFETIARQAGIQDVFLVETLEEVVEQAHVISRKGETVLFSPACASWGMYPSYVERGNHFKTLIAQLKGEYA